MIVSPLRRAPWLATSLGVAATLLLLLLSAGPAKAIDVTWSCQIQSGRTCTGTTRRNIVMSAAYHDSTTRQLGAAASTDGTLDGLYGSFSWDTEWACHSYGGKNALYPFIANGSTIPLLVRGMYSYGADGDPC